MLALERHRRILDWVNTQGSARTAEIAQTLAVTEETVRRDFEKLERDGQLLRYHGGAVRLEAARRDPSHSSRESAHVAAKQAMAAVALQQIETGDTLLFDASSSALQLARLLPDMNLTVLTSAIKVAAELSERPSIRVVMTGGVLRPHSMSCTGPLVEQSLECYHIQKAFLSCLGVDATRGLSEANDEQAALKRKMIDLSDRTYLLADHSKLGLQSSFFFAKLGDIHTLITDREPDAAFRDHLGQSGAQLLLANEAVPKTPASP
ncbi:MAG: DeoR/GlpR family DNA-binding transcription regulator [Candidatus Methylacidiphilales bacterium]|nr:DeoR/GlpR family DNA-binding transcription regulator [Candidatus Methylacidiphilales bacterium]